MKLRLLFIVKCWPFSFFAKYVKKGCYLASTFQLSLPILRLFLLMYLICTKGNKPVSNWGWTNLSFTINSLLKMLLCYSWCFHFSNINMTFFKIYKKTAVFKRDFQSYSKNPLSLKILWCKSKMTAFRMIFETSMNVRLLCLVHWKNILYWIFLMCIIYASDYWKKVLFYHFWYFQFSNFNMTFD